MTLIKFVQLLLNETYGAYEFKFTINFIRKLLSQISTSLMLFSLFFSLKFIFVS